MKTPELDKQVRLHDKTQLIGEFLEWLMSNYTVCSLVDGLTEDRYAPTGKNIDKIIAEFFNIDLVKCEKERRNYLAYLQEKT